MSNYKSLLLLLFCPLVSASACQLKPLTLADFIAKVRVLEASDKYEYAYIAEVTEVIYLSPENEGSEIKKGYTFTLSQPDELIEKRKEGQRKTRRVIFDGCEKTYKLLNEYQLFARQIVDDIYSGNSYWTRHLEEQ